LIVCSLDKAREIGLDWWMYDRHLSPGRLTPSERERFEERIDALERQLGAARPSATVTSTTPPGRVPRGAPRARRRESR
jgi:hypothetical protein